MELKKYVFTGPMRSGKSTLIETISKKIGAYKMAEVAAYLLNSGLDNKKEPLKFQEQVFKTQLEWEKGSEKNSTYEKIIMDRSLIDGLAYIRLRNLGKGLYHRVLEEAKKQRYEKIFMCEFISNPCSKDKERNDLKDRESLTSLLAEEYGLLGYSYNFILVPDMPIEKRVKFVMDEM